MSDDEQMPEAPVTALRRLPRLTSHLRTVRRQLALAGVPRSAGEDRGEEEREFKAACRALSAPSVVELGTKQSVPGRSTLHRDWVPHAAEFLGTDFQEGADVDVVADVHRLTEVTGAERFDIILSFSTFEHIKYPTLAAHEVMKALKVGGLLFVQTHQCFPIHAYPSDYFRFSRDALASLFGASMGFEVSATGYAFPAQVYSRRLADSHQHPAFLNTTLWGRKLAPTPDVFRYELDHDA